MRDCSTRTSLDEAAGKDGGHVSGNGNGVLTYESSFMPTSILAHYKPLRSSCPVKLGEARGGIDRPNSTPDSARKMQAGGRSTVSSRAGFKASRMPADPG